MLLNSDTQNYARLRLLQMARNATGGMKIAEELESLSSYFCCYVIDPDIIALVLAL
jgi:hypothetical protein